MTRYDDLIRNIRQNSISPLYLFFGDEEFLIQEAVDLIVSKTVDLASRDFNFTTVYCKGTTGAEIVNLCQTLPFMAERRLVIARDIDTLKSADIELLLSYLHSPSPSTCLVMIASQPRYEKKSIIDAVEANGVVARFYALLDREIISWIENWARQRGFSVQRDAAQYVWQTLGNDLQIINNELEKVALTLKNSKTITYDDVKSIIGDFREYTSFDLADAVGKKNIEKAFTVLTRLLQEGEQPVGLLASLAWNFRRLMRAKDMEAEGAESGEIMKKLRVIFHQTRSFQEQMRNYSIAELERAFYILTESDRMLKSSGIGGRLVLERTIIKICRA